MPAVLSAPTVTSEKGHYVAGTRRSTAALEAINRSSIRSNNSNRRSCSAVYRLAKLGGLRFRYGGVR